MLILVNYLKIRLYEYDKKKLLNLYVYFSTRLYGLQPCQCQHDDDVILMDRF